MIWERSQEPESLPDVIITFQGEDLYIKLLWPLLTRDHSQQAWGIYPLLDNPMLFQKQNYYLYEKEKKASDFKLETGFLTWNKRKLKNSEEVT